MNFQMIPTRGAFIRMELMPNIRLREFAPNKWVIEIEVVKWFFFKKWVPFVSGTLTNKHHIFYGERPIGQLAFLFSNRITDVIEFEP